MSTAVPGQREVVTLTDEQVIELDWWYPWTAGRAVAYAAWLYFFTLGAFGLVQLLSPGVQATLVFFVAIGPAVGGAIGAILGRGIRRQRIKVWHEKRVLKAEAKGLEVDERSFPLRPSNLYLVGVGASIALALFGLLNLITHVGLFESTTGFTLVMCFVMAAITTWGIYTGDNARKEHV
ncbi:hypothetical protein [Kocuria carniphila]|uniref:hypothetical protein n=1 Tax=Kocuria carniphila TaxID=262208 RepID=UPI0034CD57DF